MSSLRALAPRDDHRERFDLYTRLLKRWRKKLLIPPRWDITLEVFCPDEKPDAQGGCSWCYLPNAQFHISLSCMLEDDLAEWVIAHELLEAITSNYAQLHENALEALKEEGIPIQVITLMQTQHGDVRNEIIEWFLCILLGHGRP